MAASSSDRMIGIGLSDKKPISAIPVHQLIGSWADRKRAPHPQMETSNNRPVLTERARRSACRGRLVTAIDFRQAAGFVSRSLDQVGAVWAASQTIRCML